MIIWVACTLCMVVGWYCRRWLAKERSYTVAAWQSAQHNWYAHRDNLEAENTRLRCENYDLNNPAPKKKLDKKKK
jgi:hypothetical protein